MLSGKEIDDRIHKEVNRHVFCNIINMLREKKRTTQYLNRYNWRTVKIYRWEWDFQYDDLHI